MKSEPPASGIAKIAEYTDSVCYRIECECFSSDHSVDTWIEVDKPFDDIPSVSASVSVRFYVNTYTHPFSHGFYQRVKNACKVLLGVDEQQHEILLSAQSAKNWVSAVNKTLLTLESK